MFRDKCMETLRKYMDPRHTKHGKFIPLTSKYFGSRKDGMKRESGTLKFDYTNIQKFRSCPRSCRSDVDGNSLLQGGISMMTIPINDFRPKCHCLRCKSNGKAA